MNDIALCPCCPNDHDWIC